jgi:glycosyltransferase involved in cell wall biosynthesis
MNRQQIVMIAGRDPTLLGGGHPNYVIAHALAAARVGLEPHVFCASGRSEVVQTGYGVLHRVRSPMHYGYRNERLQRPFLARGVARHVAGLGRPGPQVLHSFGAWAASGVAASRLLERDGITAIPIASAFTTLTHENRAKVRALGAHHRRRDRLRYRRDMLWVAAVAGRAERQGYSRSALILVNYRSVSELLKEDVDQLPPVRVMPWAAAAAFDERALAGPRSRPAGRPPGIVAVARHDPRKGLDVLIRALARLAQAGVPFRAELVGVGPLRTAHERLVADLGLSEHVRITGFVDDVFENFSRAQVFVLPSLEEGSGSVALLEALQAGLPVVASRCDGIPEDVADGADALLVEPGNVEDLERALARVLSDEPLQARLGERSRAVFAERFAAERFADALGALYAELATSSSGVSEDSGIIGPSPAGSSTSCSKNR